MAEGRSTPSIYISALNIGISELGTYKAHMQFHMTENFSLTWNAKKFRNGHSCDLIIEMGKLSEDEGKMKISSCKVG